MQNRAVSVFGLGGDSLSTPENSIVSYYSALAGGAGGLVVGVRQTKDAVVVCSNHDDFNAVCGDERKVADLNWNEIGRLDAGFTYRSTVLDADNQPTGEKGSDTPWLGSFPTKRALRVQRLSDVLIQFARRCELVLLLPDDNINLLDVTLSELHKFGVENRVLLAGSYAVCQYLLASKPNTRLILVDNTVGSATEQLDLAERLGTLGLYLDWDIACRSETAGIFFEPELRDALEASSVCLYLGSDTMHYAVTPAHFKALSGITGVAGIFARGVLPTVSAITPPALIVSDDFNGTHFNRTLWSAGYSQANQDTQIYQDDGIHISIKEGGSYSGAAAVCVIPVHGRFDARTAFHVSSPRQATTFELAAICIDPGYHHIDNTDLTTRNVNLTFDVHGAPPYASSERDEDNGFRCGWNNGFNLTQIDSDWNASSANMYNKYGRDVGNGEADSPEGQLRLVRNGSYFATYYTDKYNTAWVCSGGMLLQNMPDDAYLRLAAKHWRKGGIPPENHIEFHNFRLYQF